MYVFHVKPTAVMRKVQIDFGLSDQIAESKVWSQEIAQQSLRRNEKIDYFSLIFGLSAYFELSDGLSKRLIQKVWSPIV